MNKPDKVVAIIQARMGSTRLPGKVLLDIEGAPMLLRVATRTGRASQVDEVVVATTTQAADQPIVDLCQKSGLACFRGHPTDVLDRFHAAALARGAGIIVRVTADCPVIDPELIDRTVAALIDSEPPADLALNRFVDERTYPIGLDTEVCTWEALEAAWSEADQPFQREHVMPYLYDPPGRFRVLHVKSDEPWGDLRWTVDTAEDLAFIREVYRHFAPRDDFGWREVLALVRARPDLASLNAGVPHKPLRSVDDRAAT